MSQKEELLTTKYDMTLRSPLGDQKVDASGHSPSPSFPHAFSGETRRNSDWTPINAFGGDDFGSPVFICDAIFKGGHEEYEGKDFKRTVSKSFASFVRFVALIIRR